MPRYEFSEGTSSKFWEIELKGKSFTTTYGKIGSAGQTTVKTFGSDAEAKKDYDKLIGQKIEKGYHPAGQAPPPPVATPTTATSGQYFELVEGSSSKFWEITLDGTTVKTRYGRIGSAGQETVKSYPNAGQAQAEHDKLVAEKTKKGYQLERGEAPAPPVTQHLREDRLETAIDDALDDAEAYVIYADWLQAHGDPRGELIVLQQQNKTTAANKLIEQNKQHFYGKLADARDMLEAYEYSPLGRTTTWRWGYLETIWLSNKHERFNGDLPEIDVDEALGWILGHPSARFVRELTVGIVNFEDNGYDGIAKAIGNHPMPTLRKLILGDFHSEETELNWSNMGNVQPMYKALPNLESLTLRSGSMALGKIELPNLKELIVITGGFDVGSLQSICQARWSKLERLSLQLGSDNKFTVKDLQPIFDAKAFPSVKHLGLGNTAISDAICTALVNSKIAAQLEFLDLSLGTMGDAGAAALAGGRFPRLEGIDVTDNYLTEQGLGLLKKLAKLESAAGGRRSRRSSGDAENQRDDEGDPEDRYIAAYE
jgi:uncharacterized protein (TIGR02996 family)